MGAVIRNQNELHGKVVTLKRGGKDVSGVLLAQDSRFFSGEFAFKWTDKSGVKIDAVSEEELDNIKKSFIPNTQPPKPKKMR
jgi:uncharacterized protein YodC (DUF2158 family)